MIIYPHLFSHHAKSSDHIDHRERSAKKGADTEHRFRPGLKNTHFLIAIARDIEMIAVNFDSAFNAILDALSNGRKKNDNHSAKINAQKDFHNTTSKS